jgi:hypothetical protein
MEKMNPVVVLRTGKLFEIDMAIDALKKAKIPYMAEEENAAGLRLAMPVAPAPAPGLSWTLQVPDAELARAKLVLSDLPFEIKTNPDAWDFQPTRAVKMVWKVVIVALLAILAIGVTVQLINAIRGH